MMPVPFTHVGLFIRDALSFTPEWRACTAHGRAVGYAWRAGSPHLTLVSHHAFITGTPGDLAGLRLFTPEHIVDVPVVYSARVFDLSLYQCLPVQFGLMAVHELGSGAQSPSARPRLDEPSRRELLSRPRPEPTFDDARAAHDFADTILHEWRGGRP